MEPLSTSNPNPPSDARNPTNLVAPQLLEDVQALIADVLGEDVEKVTPSATFFRDLEGESIDLLDLSFRCEKHFGVRVNFENVKPELTQADEQGFITAQSLEQLRQQYPALDLSQLGAKPRLERLRDAITVTSIAYIIQQALTKSA